MKTQIKHLITLLLIFGLTVTECSLFAHTEYARQYQVSLVSTREQARVAASRTYVYKRYFVAEKLIAAVFTVFKKLSEIHTTQSEYILQLQTRLLQKIHATLVQRTFLSATLSTSNHYTPLYIA